MKTYSVRADLIYWNWTINKDIQDTDEYLDEANRTYGVVGQDALPTGGDETSPIE